MSKTRILPPAAALQDAWAATGSFSDDSPTTQNAERTMSRLAALRERQVSSEEDTDEQQYMQAASSAINSALRTLEIAHKGRSLNFDENKELRKRTSTPYKR